MKHSERNRPQWEPETVYERCGGSLLPHDAGTRAMKVRGRGAV